MDAKAFHILGYPGFLPFEKLPQLLLTASAEALSSS
jgi:hypothetical protein